MELRVLQYFLAVAREQSISAAAESLHLSQPTLSTQLKALVQKSQGGRFGARDLRRTIRKAVEDPAAERLIDGTLASGGTLVVDADENGEVVLK